MLVLLQIKDICKAYGAAIILEDATASFGADQKIGMIGRNGSGKSTLCRIITGHEKADSGKIIRNGELRLSYLEQHDDFKTDETALEFLMRKSGAEHWQCGLVAARFQLKNEILDQPIQSLPGGFQTRVKLTAMLLGDPNFLILDEPSNYLDLSTLILLENFLLNFKGGYLIVSHDREFLKRTCDHTLEAEAGKLTLYPGDIEEYFEFKEEQLAQKKAYNRGVEKKRVQLKAFVDRFRAKASTASRAQSKMKQLEKLKTIGVTHQMSTVHIRIPQVPEKAGIGLFCEDLVIGYPEKEVASGINFDIERGRHVAILGDNGEGKTTFLRTISGDLEPRGGSFRWGAGMKTAYYAQHVFSTLNPEDTIYSHLLSASEGEALHQDVLAMSGSFLFKGDDVKKKVKVLSGGERARLLLAGLLLSKCQVLLLDEPTNHLDFETVEALANGLKKFKGLVFFISHDRTFVNLVASHILEVKNERIRRYPGTYEDYVYHLEMIAKGEVVESRSREKKASSKKIEKNEKKASEEETEKSQEPAQKKKKAKSEISKVAKEMTKTEKRMKHYEKERDDILKEIRKNPFHFSEKRNKKLKDCQIAIEEAEQEWCHLQEKLDQLK